MLRSPVCQNASMNEIELAEYARKKGLYVEQIKSWEDLGRYKEVHNG